MKTQKQYWQKLQDPRWQRKRLEILNRAEFCCESCGDSESQLQVHHGYYEKGREPWEYEDDTLWCLCDKCHEDAHRGRDGVYLELAKYKPGEIWPIVWTLMRTDGRDSIFFAQISRIMEKRPGWIERVVNILHESLFDISPNGAAAAKPAPKQEQPPTLSELDLLWSKLLEAVGSVSQFTRGYLQAAYPSSFNGRLFVIGFDPEFADHLGLVDNAKNHAVLQCKLAELGYADCKIMFVTHESKASSC